MGWPLVADPKDTIMISKIKVVGLGAFLGPLSWVSEDPPLRE